MMQIQESQIESACALSTIIIPNLGIDLEREFRKVFEVNQALSLFLAGEMDMETYLDICEFWEQDMDRYLLVADANLQLLGF
ncbi:hypothetical protein [Coleofasciculus sp. FACHB-1120]|uniref:hypothetical protein n=1 Tax=Coleofasciculus sp. FACHB-1120 TaxID=2692783 RepID=UPI00168443D9|nr:hypothetical protein [Coleofasciculus sp. FACHB-1120]MBD2743664.1 hypothetical protein [Coleofasciculus sp. FACHB-1120]